MNKTFDQIVAEVLNWLAIVRVDSEDTYQQFVSTHPDNLIKYHHSLGRDIRNEFRLWNINWDPELIDGVDHSPNHPDAVSMRIIKEVHKQANRRIDSSA